MGNRLCALFLMCTFLLSACSNQAPSTQIQEPIATEPTTQEEVVTQENPIEEEPVEEEPVEEEPVEEEPVEEAPVEEEPVEEAPVEEEPVEEDEPEEPQGRVDVCAIANVVPISPYQPTALPSGNTYEVQLQTYENAVYYDDEATILLARCNYALPHLVAYDGNGAVLSDDVTAAAFNDGFAIWWDDVLFNRAVETARQGYEEWGDATSHNFSQDLVCSVYQQENLISIYGQLDYYCGGAHGVYYIYHWLFDTNTGTFLDPLALAEDIDVFVEDMVDFLLADATRQRDEEGAGLLFKRADFEPWYTYPITFDETGMVVTFPAYAIASYSRGTPQIHVSYENLAPYYPQEVLAIFSGQGS